MSIIDTLRKEFESRQLTAINQLATADEETTLQAFEVALNFDAGYHLLRSCGFTDPELTHLNYTPGLPVAGQAEEAAKALMGVAAKLKTSPNDTLVRELRDDWLNIITHLTELATPHAPMNMHPQMFVAVNMMLAVKPSMPGAATYHFPWDSFFEDLAQRASPAEPEVKDIEFTEGSSFSARSANQG